MSIWNMELPENAITATDSAGKDLLRFALKWGEKVVRIRIPTYGEWDQYVYRVTLLLRKLSLGMDDIQLPDSMAGVVTEDMFPSWSLLIAHLMLHKQVSKEIEDILFTYLKPEFGPGSQPTIKEYGGLWERIKLFFRGKDAKKAYDDMLFRKYLMNNAPIDCVARMFAALLVPDALLKKNIQYLLTQIYQSQVGLESTPTSTKNTVSPRTTLIPAPTFSFN